MSELTRSISKTITIEDASFYVIRMPLAPSCEVFQTMLKTFGEPLVKVVGKIMDQRGNKTFKKERVSLFLEDLKEAIAIYAKNIEPQQTLNFFKSILSPEYVKHKNQGVDLQDLHKQFGLAFLFILSFEVLKFNYDDFLAFS